MITQKELKRLLNYDSNTGIFTWRTDGNNQYIVKGNNVGHLDSSTGYVTTTINNKKYTIHRLAWLYQEGHFPEHQVDHINRIRNDNRWCNLRHVTQQCNTRNSSKRKDNTSGITGVCWHKSTGKWLAKITVNKRTKHIGVFINLDQAVLARWKAEVKYDFPNCNSDSLALQYLKENKLT